MSVSFSTISLFMSFFGQIHSYGKVNIGGGGFCGQRLINERAMCLALRFALNRFGFAVGVSFMYILVFIFARHFIWCCIL